MVNSEFDRATVSNLFYNNRLELLRKLQKTFVVEDLHNTQSNACILQQWTDYYYREVVKAIYGHGKYRLAPGSEIFYNNKPGVSQKFLVWVVRDQIWDFRALEQREGVGGGLVACFEGPQWKMLAIWHL